MGVTRLDRASVVFKAYLRLTIEGVFFNTYVLVGKNQSLTLLMKKAEDIHMGETKEVRPMEKAEDSSKGQLTKRIIKGQRGISLRACVAKATGWTLEKANAAQAKEATINKQSDSK